MSSSDVWYDGGGRRIHARENARVTREAAVCLRAVTPVTRVTPAQYSPDTRMKALESGGCVTGAIRVSVTPVTPVKRVYKLTEKASMRKRDRALGRFRARLINWLRWGL